MPELPKEAVEPVYRIIRCKVCEEQMQSYGHGNLGCRCKDWGDDLDDNSIGVFNPERHEFVRVAPIPAIRHQRDEELRERLRSGLRDLDVLEPDDMMVFLYLMFEGGDGES